jgi:hypothetical protein
LSSHSCREVSSVCQAIKSLNSQKVWVSAFKLVGVSSSEYRNVLSPLLGENEIMNFLIDGCSALQHSGDDTLAHMKQRISCCGCPVLALWSQITQLTGGYITKTCIQDSAKPHTNCYR